MNERLTFLSVLHLAKYTKLKQEERPAFHRFILFYLEYTKLLHVPPYQQAVMIIDASGAGECIACLTEASRVIPAGFAQLDMDLGSFLVELIYNYYPDAVATGNKCGPW